MSLKDTINSRIRTNKLQAHILMFYPKMPLSREIIFSVQCHFILATHHLVIKFNFSFSAKSIFKFLHSLCVTESSLSPQVCWLSRLGQTSNMSGVFRGIFCLLVFFTDLSVFLCLHIFSIHSFKKGRYYWTEMWRSFCVVLRPLVWDGITQCYLLRVLILPCWFNYNRVFLSFYSFFVFLLKLHIFFLLFLRTSAQNSDPACCQMNLDYFHWVQPKSHFLLCFPQKNPLQNPVKHYYDWGSIFWESYLH